MEMTLICGGIGSGKSVVSRILRLRGHEVYDCDAEASRLMLSESAIRRHLVCDFGENVFLPDGSLDRRLVASVIFSDPEAKRRLDSVVHAAVRADIGRWLSAVPGRRFVETAIPATARLTESPSTRIWVVEAPLSLRIERVMARSGLARCDVESRIRCQSGELEAVEASGLVSRHIVNDGIVPLLPQISLSSC